MPLLPLASITVPERLRQDYGGVEFDKLKTSLEEFGQLQSLLVTPEPHVLIAGGRRYAAMTELGWPEARVMVTNGVPSRDVALEMEIEENVRRKDMSWQERAIGVDRIHKIKKIAHPHTRWGVRETGELLGMEFSYVSKLSLVAERLLLEGDSRDNEVWNANGPLDAINIILKRKRDRAAALLAARETKARDALAKKLGITGNGQDKPSADDLDKLIKDSMADDDSAKPLTLINLSSYYHCADFRDHLDSIGPHSFDHVVTDIPYGTDMENLDRIVDLDIVADQHDREENVSLFEPFLSESFRVLRPGGFCVFWYDLIHHQQLVEIARSAGFRVTDWPLIWVKSHACLNMAAAQNFTKATEVAMVCRKGPATLQSQQPRNWIEASSAEDRKRYDNPFAKPKAVWDFIFKAISSPGQTVLDPFAGESSSALSAITLGLQPYNIELVPRHHERALQHLQHYYRQLYKGRVQFV